jgi:hypothetical protein
MSAPGWLRWALATAMIAVALYHSSRLVASGRRAPQHEAHAEVDIELTHAAMGVAMTLMVLDALAPAYFLTLGWLFVVPTFWFVSRALHTYGANGLRSADVAARQVIGCTAMVYMLVVLAAPSSRPAVARTVTGAMSGMSMSGPSALSAFVSPIRVIVVVATVVLCGWTIARMRGRAADAGPALGLGCQLAVNVTTIYMLLAM